METAFIWREVKLFYADKIVDTIFITNIYVKTYLWQSGNHLITLIINMLQISAVK